MNDDDIQQCQCGSTHWTISRDGVIECAECRHPDGELMAVRRNFKRWARRNEVKIVAAAEALGGEQ